MNRYLVTMLVLLSALIVFPVSAAVPSVVNLAKLADWNIVLAKDASPIEVYAAEECQRFFAQASGIQLPIARQSARERPPPGREARLRVKPTRSLTYNSRNRR